MGVDYASASLQKSERDINSEIETLYAQFRTTHFKKGELILLANDEPSVAYAVKSGFVRSYVLTEATEERSVSFVVKDELLPVSWLFKKSTTALFNYIAHTDCELYVIDPDIFHKFLNENSDLAYEILNHSMNNNVTRMLEIQALEQPNARLKLLHTLYYFCISYGKTILKDVITINIPLTQKDLASFTGLTRETITLEIAGLKQANIISEKRKYYSVNINTLRQIINETGSDFPDLQS